MIIDALEQWSRGYLNLYADFKILLPDDNLSYVPYSKRVLNLTMNVRPVCIYKYFNKILSV